MGKVQRLPDDGEQDFVEPIQKVKVGPASQASGPNVSHDDQIGEGGVATSPKLR